MSNPFYIRIASSLMHERQRRGWTPEWLSHISTIPVRLVIAIEAGKGREHALETVAIATILGVDIRNLKCECADSDSRCLVAKYDRVDALFRFMRNNQTSNRPSH